MLKRLSILIAFTSLMLMSANAEQTCGLGADDCKTPNGAYNIELPERTEQAREIPALIYFHGAGGSGQRSLKNRKMVETFLKRGYAVIAPSGLKRPNSRFGPGWSFHPDRPQQRDELAFANEVLADAAVKFDIDRNNILMGGFSIGGSLTWYLACRDPNIAKAYAPVGGAFWRPHPKAEDCNGSVRLLHTHGWRDSTVPLEGRVLGGGRIVQGDVFYGLQLMREVNGCDQLRADEYEKSEIYWKRWWTRCAPDSALQFNLHYGGHRVPASWANEAINWFENLDKPQG